MEVVRPIFVIGAGRSGSTALHRVLARHPQLAWLSGFLSKYPGKPHRHRLLLQAIDAPLVGSYLGRRFEPWEIYDYWDRIVRGFSEPFRDLTAEDVTPWTRSRVRLALAETLTARRNRLCIKITGWPRCGYLKEVFPDAQFIHIVRDGRAVANSNIQVDFWDGWHGPENWRFGPLSAEEAEVWRRHDYSFVALAGIQWNRLMAATIAASERLSDDDFLQVRYEDACAQPIEAFRCILQFCGLEWTPAFEKHVRAARLDNQNDKWRKDLTPTQQAALQDIVSDYLTLFGYVV